MNKSIGFRPGMLLAVLLASTVFVAACTSNKDRVKTTAQDSAIDTAKTRNNYIPKNDIEGHNYNARQILADNPATLIWCSVYPQNPNVKPFTVPIVGKLTSGNKRPFPTQIVRTYENSGTYNPELPGSDGFYGTSGEYRYGFDPAGNYHDFYNLETYCTSEPTIIQKNTTDIMVSVSDDQLSAATNKAEAALTVCRKADPDPSKACPAAVDALGVQG